MQTYVALQIRTLTRPTDLLRSLKIQQSKSILNIRLRPISPFPLTSLFHLPHITMSLPPNIHVSTHPCLQAKLSQLRSASTSPRETRALIHEISSIIGVEAFAKGLTVAKTGTVGMVVPS